MFHLSELSVFNLLCFDVFAICLLSILRIFIVNLNFFLHQLSELSVFDLRVRFDVFVFSILLIFIVNLKLSIHGLRTSDIQVPLPTLRALLHPGTSPRFTSFTGTKVHKHAYIFSS